ncbi:MAG TPA: hypothetical protein VK034_08480 [Enhygromyxa sp.]|nr:hypothetical protein [Enhygromyxa sp.]
MRDNAIVGLSALGGTVVAAACTPKVSAVIVVDETRPPEHQRATDKKPERPKRPAGPDRTPPKVDRAELVGTSRIRIHFSEPVVVAEGFDPADFRISVLRLYLHQQVSYSVAYYYDPGYQNYGARLVLSHVKAREDRLEIEFTPELPPWLCRQLDYSYGYDTPGTDSDAGLFLHYAAGQIPIRDEAGNQMDSFGAEWVFLGRQDPPQARREIVGQAVAQAGRNLVSIACSPPIPPGPR